MLPSRRRAYLVIAALTCLLLLAGAACSRGKDDRASTSTSSRQERTSTTLASVAFEEWSTTVDNACADLNATYAVLGDADPADADEAVAYADQVDEFADGILESVASAGVPVGKEADATALIDDLRKLSAATGTLADRAGSGDAEGTASAASRVAELGAAINPLSAELGVPSCGGF